MLRLGSGKAGGDGGLYTKGDLYKVVNDGSLVLRNTSKPLSLSRISGSGSAHAVGCGDDHTDGHGGDVHRDDDRHEGHARARRDGRPRPQQGDPAHSAGARLDAGTAGCAVADHADRQGHREGRGHQRGRGRGRDHGLRRYTQRAKGELVLGEKPLKVAGAVRLAGGVLDLRRPGRTRRVVSEARA